MYLYRLQGLLVGSDFPLASLAGAKAGAEPDVRVHGGPLPPELPVEELARSEPAYKSPLRNPYGEPYSRMWRLPQTGTCYFRSLEGFSWAVDAEGRNIWIDWPDAIDLDVITAFFLSKMLTFALHLRGYVCLHASAIAVDGRAVVFAGDPGMGKSSTAAAFAERGFPALSDDVSAIRREPDGQIVVLPGAPRLCLCPDAVEFLYGPGSAERFPLFLPAEEKRLVRLDSAPGRFQTAPAPLEAIYLLAPRSAQSRAPRLEPIVGANRMVRLMYNGFMTLALDREHTALEFPLLGEIARTVRIQELVPSTDPRRMGALCALVIDDVRKAAPAPALP